MDTLNPKNVQEERDGVSSIATPSLVPETQEGSRTLRNSRVTHLWQQLRNLYKKSTFSPEWLPSPWNRAITGYLAALLTPGIAILLTFWLAHVFQDFIMAGMLTLLAIWGVALLWGIGPGLLATLLGMLLFNLTLLPSQFSFSLVSLSQIVETILFFIAGILISTVTSNIERAHAEAVIARSKQAADHASEVEAIFEAIVDGIFVYDADAHLLRTNAAARAFNPSTEQPGYETFPYPERFSSYYPRDKQGQLLDPSDLPVMHVLRGEILTGSHTADIILRQPDGTDALLNVSGATIHDNSGKVRGAVVVTRDLTERSRLEQRTQKALHTLLEMAALIGQVEGDTDIPIDSKDQRISKTAQHMSKIACDFLGCKRLSISVVEPETEILRPLAVVGLSPEQEEQWWIEQSQQKSRIIDSPDPILAQRLQDRETVLVDMTQPPWNSLPNPYGILTMLLAPLSIGDKVVGILSLDYERMDHEYSQEDMNLAAGVARLIALVIERERLLQERAEFYARELALRETKERMDKFLSIVSHELKTPLTTIKGSVQFARMRLAALEEIQTVLDRAERQVDVQDRLVGDLLDIARLQAEKLELRPEPCDIAHIAREAVDDLRSLYPARAIHVELEEGEMPPIIADAERIGQVLNNYLTNALKYSPVDSPVYVQVRREGTMVRVSVRDEGPGLTPQEQERIWERFYQVEGIKRQRGSNVGLGLGLYICRILIEQHQGEVGVESTKGKGSTFWFTLPFAEKYFGYRTLPPPDERPNPETAIADSSSDSE